MLDESKFGTLTGWHRVWAVAAIHGERDKLTGLRQALGARFRARDRIVFLGNYLGIGTRITETVDELLALRRSLLALPGMMPQDIVFLRGVQEEMWQKLLQLQLALDPPSVLTWMLRHGVATTIEAYGSSPQDGLAAAKGGTVLLSRWTGKLRETMARHGGHRELISSLKRACVTDDGSLLFVHAGLDPSRPLEAQRDAFWWNPGGFMAMDRPYGNFRLVVRGCDPNRHGTDIGAFRATLDGCCGVGGVLTACCFDRHGRVVDQIDI